MRCAPKACIGNELSWCASRNAYEHRKVVDPGHGSSVKLGALQRIWACPMCNDDPHKSRRAIIFRTHIVYCVMACKHCHQLQPPDALHTLQSVQLFPLMAAEARHVAGPCLATTAYHTHTQVLPAHMCTHTVLSTCTLNHAMHPDAHTHTTRVRRATHTCGPQWHIFIHYCTVHSFETVHSHVNIAKTIM